MCVCVGASPGLGRAAAGLAKLLGRGWPGSHGRCGLRLRGQRSSGCAGPGEGSRLVRAAPVPRHSVGSPQPAPSAAPRPSPVWGVHGGAGAAGLACQGSLLPGPAEPGQPRRRSRPPRPQQPRGAGWGCPGRAGAERPVPAWLAREGHPARPRSAPRPGNTPAPAAEGLGHPVGPLRGSSLRPVAFN